MLAQNFKTAIELDISDKEFAALASVLRMLEREELKHVDAIASPYNPAGVSYEGHRFSALFNMVGFAEHTKCGTAACIAGTSDLMFGTDFALKFWAPRALPESLYQLFAPDDLSAPQMAEIRPEQAAVALRNYLTHGEPRWGEALA